MATKFLWIMQSRPGLHCFEVKRIRRPMNRNPGDLSIVVVLHACGHLCSYTSRHPNPHTGTLSVFRPSCCRCMQIENLYACYLCHDSAS